MLEIRETSSIAVDTLVDLRKVRKIFENKHKKKLILLFLIVMESYLIVIK